MMVYLLFLISRTMVMETPGPQEVGREFVRQYYTMLHEAPLHLHRFVIKYIYINLFIAIVNSFKITIYFRTTQDQTNFYN